MFILALAILFLCLRRIAKCGPALGPTGFGLRDGVRKVGLLRTKRLTLSDCAIGVAIRHQHLALAAVGVSNEWQ